MKYLYCIILSTIVFHYAKVNAQALYPDVKLSGINIVPPVIFSTEINKEQFKHVEDSLFDTHLFDYNRLYNNEIWFRKKIYRNYHFFFKKSLCSYLPSFNINESIIYKNELKKLMKGIKPHYNNNTFKISDTLKELLLKYPGEQFLLTDIKEYLYFTTPQYKGKGDCYNYISIQCVIVDVKTSFVVFYNSKIWRNTINLSAFPPSFRTLFEGLKIDKHVRRQMNTKN